MRRFGRFRSSRAAERVAPNPFHSGVIRDFRYSGGRQEEPPGPEAGGFPSIGGILGRDYRKRVFTAPQEAFSVAEPPQVRVPVRVKGPAPEL